MADLGADLHPAGSDVQRRRNPMAGGSCSAVNYDLARQLASVDRLHRARSWPARHLAVADAGAPCRNLARRRDRAARRNHKEPRGAGLPEQWVNETPNTWKRLCDPVAEQISAVGVGVAEEAKGMKPDR